MRIGLSSIIGEGFGSGSFQISEVAGEPPAAGTILYTVNNTTYPIAQGGAEFSENGTTYASQDCSVYVKADGVGGSYYDWANVFNVAYKPYGQIFRTESGTLYIEINSTNYPNGTYSTDYFHDGSGSYSSNGTSSYTESGMITSDSNAGYNQIFTPIGYFTYESWTGTEYYHNGSGGYTTVKTGLTTASDGDYIGNDPNSGFYETEVPSGSGSWWTWRTWTDTDYYFQLSGHTYQTVQNNTTNVSTGDFIRNDGSFDYYWNSNGTYYT